MLGLMRSLAKHGLRLGDFCGVRHDVDLNGVAACTNGAGRNANLALMIA